MGSARADSVAQYFRHHVCQQAGDTRSPGLQKVVSSTFSFAEPAMLSLSIVPLKNTSNMVADFFSRCPVFQDKWALHWEVFQELVERWGSPYVDLFATRSTAKVVCFCSLARGDQPWALDALMSRWVFSWGYAFPPLRLIPVVLWKFQQ